MQVPVAGGFVFRYKCKISDKIPLKFSRIKNNFLFTFFIFPKQKNILLIPHVDAPPFWWRAH